MLALTRKVGESIVIEDNIEITIISITGDQIKLGIDAPKSISIHRKEIHFCGTWYFNLTSIIDSMKPGKNIIDAIVDIFQSFISDEISDFNSSVF